MKSMEKTRKFFNDDKELEGVYHGELQGGA